MKSKLIAVFALAFFTALNHQISTASAQGTAITYQGRLRQSSATANGSYDFTFQLFDAVTGGASQGGPLTNNAVILTDGLFAVTLDFGASPFSAGAPRWLEIAARSSSGGAFGVLNPRQVLTATPYAITAGNVSGLVAASQLAGAIAPANIGAGTISSTMLATGSVTSVQLASGAVGSNQLANGAVNASNLFMVPAPLLPYLTIGDPSGRTNVNFGLSIAAVGPNKLVVGSLGLAYLFSTNGALLTTFTNPVPATSNLFGLTVGNVGPDRVLISGLIATNILKDSGTPTPTTTNGLCGVVYLFRTNGTLLATLVDPLPYEGDSFGTMVTDAGGGRIVVGDPFQDSGFGSQRLGNGFNNGEAYLFDTNSNFLVTMPNPSPFAPFLKGESFGAAGAALGTGQFVVGNRTIPDPQHPSTGFVSLYPSNFNAGLGSPFFTNQNTSFGSALASVGPNTLFINGDHATNGSNLVNLYHANGTLLLTLSSPNPSLNDGFGISLSSVGSDKVAVGADGSGPPPIAAYVFNTNGGLVATLANPSPASNDGFSDQLAGMGPNAVAVSAQRANTFGSAAGAVYLYSLSQTSIYAPGVIAEGVRVGSITSASLADSSVTTVKIADGSVTAAKLDPSIGQWTAAGSNVYRLSGNVGIGKTNPTAALDVNGTAKASAFQGNGGSLTSLNASQLASGTLSDARLSPNVVLIDTAQTFQADKSFGSFSRLLADAGSAALPGIAFSGNVSAGIFHPAGNEVGFSTLGLERMRIDSAGQVGIGVSNPLHTLHVGTSAGTNTLDNSPNKIVIENSADNGRATLVAVAGIGSPDSTNRVEVFMEADEGQRRGIIGTLGNHELQIRENNTTILTLATNTFVGIGTGSPTNKLHVVGGATFSSSAGGANQNVVWVPGSASWSFTSDRNTKEQLVPVDTQAVLAKVALLPIAEWNYIGYGQRHLGPMAQDFHAQFPLNGDDKSLNDADLHGVALAAIQGLNQKLEETRAENAELKQRLAALEKLVRDQY